jgi:hypothetical protein
MSVSQHILGRLARWLVRSPALLSRQADEAETRPTVPSASSQAERWENCRDPHPMLRALAVKLSDRKARLLACHHLRRYSWDLLHARSRCAVETTERYADGQADQADLRAAFALAALACRDEQTRRDSHHDLYYHEWLKRQQAADLAQEVARLPLDQKALLCRGHSGPPEELCALIRDLVGNPFRPVALGQSGLTREDRRARRIARGIYAEGDFESLPVLADALEDAGCDEAALLAHCRIHGRHAKGCWVIDLVLDQH